MKKNIGICVGITDFKDIRNIKETGFDFVETSFSELAKTEQSVIDESADLLKELGLPCISMNGLIVGDFAMVGEKADHAKIKEHIESTLEKVKKLGTKNFVMGSGRARSVPEGYPREKALEQLRELIGDVLAPAAAKYGAVIAIEELRKEECNMFVTCKETVQFIKELGVPNVKLLVDYYHAMLGGDTLDEIASYGDYISHVHIASPSNKRMIPLPCDGDDYGAFFAALDNAGYKAGNISLEGSAGDNRNKNLKTSLEYLRTL